MSYWLNISLILVLTEATHSNFMSLQKLIDDHVVDFVEIYLIIQLLLLAFKTFL
jgi:hypothetical protein